jgi:hypothetical protein
LAGKWPPRSELNTRSQPSEGRCRKSAGVESVWPPRLELNQLTQRS